MQARAEPTEDELIEAAMESAAGPEPDMEETVAPAQREAPRAPSPTLDALEKKRRPRPATVCETCPHSVWFTSPTDVKCYCRVMYLVTWSVKEPNQITACDGIYVGQED